MFLRKPSCEGEGPWERSESNVSPGGEWAILLYLVPRPRQGHSVTSKQSQALGLGLWEAKQGQWEEGESREIKPRALGSMPEIPEAGFSHPSERRLQCKHGWASCGYRASTLFTVL